MYKFRKILILFFFIFLVVGICYIDYSNLSWKNNTSEYLTVIVSVVSIINLAIQNRYEKRNRQPINDAKEVTRLE